MALPSEATSNARDVCINFGAMTGKDTVDCVSFGTETFSGTATTRLLGSLVSARASSFLFPILNLRLLSMLVSVCFSAFGNGMLVGVQEPSL